MAVNPCVCWDFTIGSEFIELDDLLELCKKHCKKWHFQEEIGNETGYEHFQGRIHFRSKTRNPKYTFPDFPEETHWSVTSKCNMNNFDYVTKDHTRIDGPWTSQMVSLMEPIKLPIQLRHIKSLRPGQQRIIDSATNNIDFRCVNILVDFKGKHGKSTICQWIECHRLGRSIPFCNDYKDAMRMVMNLEKEWHSPLYIFDVPRGLEKKKLFQFFSAVETIKDGTAYDDRYKFKKMIFDSPVIWVFTNKIPDITLLSADRWKFWAPADDDFIQVTYKQLKESELDGGYGPIVRPPTPPRSPRNNT